MERIKKVVALLLSFMMILPCLPIKGIAAANTGVFADTSSSWAKSEIEYFAEQGWIKGYPDGTFGPERKITRAEFTAIINNVFNYTEAAERCFFSDVYETDWYYQAILIALQQGYIKGYPDQTFKPNANISRCEAAVILARLLNMDNGHYKSEIQCFTDAQDIPEWAGGGIGALTAHKIIGGYPDGTFAGTNFITRAETVALIKRAYNFNIAAHPAENEAPSKKREESSSGSVGDPLSINWVENVQASMTEFVVGAEVELEIACDEEAEISWSVTQGDLLGKLASNKVWWRLPDNAGQYTVTVTVKEGRKRASLSRTVKVIPYTPSGDAIADITALNGGIAPIMSYNTTVGIPSMIIGRYSPKKIHTAEDAIDSLNDIKELMNMENPREEFKLSRSQSRNNITSYVLRQVYKGIPVSGGQIGIDVDSMNNVISLGGHYYPDVRLSGLSVVPAVDKSEAQAIVENSLAAMGNHPEASLEFVSTTLIVDIVNDNPELVWGISLNIGVETWEYYIHAQSGKVIDKFLMSPLYSDKEVVDTTSTLRNGKTIINVVKVTEANDVYYVLHDRKRKIQIFDMKSRGYSIDKWTKPPKLNENPTPAWPGEVVKDNNNTWDFLNTAFKPRRDALYAFINFSRICDFFSETFKRDSIDGIGGEIKVSVNVGFGSDSLDYAFWLGEKELFGIGNKGDKAKALDVLAHEYTHAVAYYSVKDDTGRGFKCSDYSESAAISESIPDILGTLVEASVKKYSVGDDNFREYGEDSGKVIRDMSAAKVDHLSKFINTGDATAAMYSNSGILSTAFYKMTSHPDGIKDIELLANVWYDTLFEFEPKAKFKDCREQFFRCLYNYRQQDTAESNKKKYSITNKQIEVAKKAFDDVGITDDVKDTAWYASVIKKAKDKKIIFGYTDGNIKPEKTVARAEFLVMVMRASKITAPKKQSIDEKLTNHWAGAEVTFAKQEKWIGACWLDPAYIEKPITHAEACTLAFGIMNTQHQLTRIQLYKYVDGQRSEKGKIWGRDKFHDFVSGLDIVPRDDRTQLIKAAQERLNWQGYQLKTDGLYGEDTIKAVRSFQKKVGIKQTGMVDNLTWEALNYFGLYQMFTNGCFEGSFKKDILYLAPWQNLNRAEACKILTSSLN